MIRPHVCMVAATLPATAGVLWTGTASQDARRDLHAAHSEPDALNWASDGHAGFGRPDDRTANPLDRNARFMSARLAAAGTDARAAVTDVWHPAPTQASGPAPQIFHQAPVG